MPRPHLTNLWSTERYWFTWTDYDLEGTKVSGSVALIEAIQADTRLECRLAHALTALVAPDEKGTHIGVITRSAA